jgi:PTS system fructose-specific IIA component/PTS system nitrogen regulatory IIA component
MTIAGAGAGAGDEAPFPVVDVPAEAATAEAVVRFLVGELATAGTIEAAGAEEVVAKILDREELGSTAVGRGVAIPHAATPLVGGATMIAGRLAAPVDWSALDGRPVRLACVCLAPASEPKANLRQMGMLAKYLPGLLASF